MPNKTISETFRQFENIKALEITIRVKKESGILLKVS